MTWVVVETYYKYGEYNLHIFYDDSSLRDFIITKLTQYGKSKLIDNIDDILYLIDLVEECGNHRVDEQLGWGVREIEKI